jgi:hypothetical protein
VIRRGRNGRLGVAAVQAGCVGGRDLLAREHRGWRRYYKLCPYAQAGSGEYASLMRYLELRRHTRRKGQDPHISQAGLDLARKAGDGMGPFVRVVSSPAVRCIETAVAMGFAVGEIYQPVQETLKTKTVRKLGKLLPMNASFTERAQAMREHKAGGKYAVACLPEADFANGVTSD